MPDFDYDDDLDAAEPYDIEHPDPEDNEYRVNPGYYGEDDYMFGSDYE